MSGLGKPLALVGVATVILIAAWMLFANQDGYVKEIPYYDPTEEGFKQNIREGEHHVVSDFKLINQAGDTITRAEFTGKITVVDFFFTPG